MSSISKNNLKVKNKIIYKSLSILSLLIFAFCLIYLAINFNNKFKDEEIAFREDIISLSAPMTEEIESLYADSEIDDKTISSIVQPALETDMSIVMVRVWNRDDFLQIAGYRNLDGTVAISLNDPMPFLSVENKLNDVISGKNQNWKLNEIDRLLNILNQQQLISDEYDNLSKSAKIDMELRGEIYNLQNMVLREMPAFIKKYPDLLAARDLMNQSLDALEMDTKDDIMAGQAYSEDAISEISTVLELYRVSRSIDVTKEIQGTVYQPIATTVGGLLFNKLKWEQQFIPVTRPAVNDNLVEVAAVVEIITARRAGDCLTFWTWQWLICPFFLILAIFFFLLSCKKERKLINE